MLRLADIEGGEQASGAYAVDATGRLIAGFGTSADGQQALVWVDRRPVLLEDALLQAGGSLPAGWTLREVRAMSSDGRVLAGNGTNPDGNPEGFRVLLPSALYDRR
jgi:uncharacterized membrane protein